MIGRPDKPHDTAGLICVDPFPRIITTPPHYSFLRIADGCSSACRFCAIPKIRGRLKSEQLDDLINEAAALEKSGVKEYWIVDPKQKRVEIYINKNNTYHLEDEAEGEGTVSSEIVEGFSVSVGEVF